MKKTISIIAIFLLSIFILSACDISSISLGGKPKDADYLYDWLEENGTLVGGTSLQYSETDANGDKFILCYNTNYVEKLRWQVQYTTKDAAGRTINAQLFLFYDDTKSMSRISVYGYGTFDDYYRSMEYYHEPNIFTKNSPIEYGDFSGSTVVKDVFIPGQGSTTVVDDTPGLQTELNNMDCVCKSDAQKTLCKILDWLEESFCPTANMKMSDFGYEKY